MEQYSLKETKEMLDFVLEMAEVSEKVFVDGKFEMSKLALFMGPLMMIQPALDNVADVEKELRDMDDEERAELVAYIQEKVDLEDDKAEMILERALEMVVAGYALLRAFRA